MTWGWVINDRIFWNFHPKIGPLLFSVADANVFVQFMIQMTLVSWLIIIIFSYASEMDINKWNIPK